MNALGKHLLLELKDCDREVLNDLSFLKDMLQTAASEAGAISIVIPYTNSSNRESLLAAFSKFLSPSKEGQILRELASLLGTW